MCPLFFTLSANHATTANEDIVILGNGVTRTIDVSANESAQQVAAKINVETAILGKCAVLFHQNLTKEAAKVALWQIIH